VSNFRTLELHNHLTLIPTDHSTTHYKASQMSSAASQSIQTDSITRTMYQVPYTDPSASLTVEGEAVYTDNSSHLVRHIWPLTDNIAVLDYQSNDGSHTVRARNTRTLAPVTLALPIVGYKAGTTFTRGESPPGWKTSITLPPDPPLPNITIYRMGKAAQQPTPEPSPPPPTIASTASAQGSSRG